MWMTRVSMSLTNDSVHGDNDDGLMMQRRESLNSLLISLSRIKSSSNWLWQIIMRKWTSLSAVDWTAVRINIHVLTMYMRTHPHRRQIPFFDDDITVIVLSLTPLTSKHDYNSGWTQFTRLEDYWLVGWVVFERWMEGWPYQLRQRTPRRHLLCILFRVVFLCHLPAFVRLRRAQSSAAEE
jgi:hypothetical protein